MSHFSYVSLLRGINVSGYKKIAMGDLKALYEALPLTQVSTYIQSGNVVFSSERNDPEGLAAQLEQQLLTRYGFEVRVLIRTAAQLAEIVARNPFLQRANLQSEALHVTFLAAEPSPERLAQLKGPDSGSDEYRIEGREVYVYCPDGYGRTKLTNTFFEQKLKTTATTRNWKTVNQLLAMSSQLS